MALAVNIFSINFTLFLMRWIVGKFELQIRLLKKLAKHKICAKIFIGLGPGHNF